MTPRGQTGQVRGARPRAGACKRARGWSDWGRGAGTGAGPQTEFNQSGQGAYSARERPRARERGCRARRPQSFAPAGPMAAVARHRPWRAPAWGSAAARAAPQMKSTSDGSNNARCLLLFAAWVCTRKSLPLLPAAAWFDRRRRWLLPCVGGCRRRRSRCVPLLPEPAGRRCRRRRRCCCCCCCPAHDWAGSNAAMPVWAGRGTLPSTTRIVARPAWMVVGCTREAAM